MDDLCIRCKGKGLCGKRCKILTKFMENTPKIKTHFSGSSPPEVFVGRASYPNVFSGILSPTIKGNTEFMSSPEIWVEKNLSIEKVLELRGQMIYGRQLGNVHAQRSTANVTQEIAMASKPVSAEYFLKREPKQEFSLSKFFSVIGNPAPIQKVLLEENPKIDKKIDYLVSDYDVKTSRAIRELYSSQIKVSAIQKIFSVGLLGVKDDRKLVPTRWSITAVDDMISKQILEKVKTYQELNEILIFSDSYNGNHYEILFLPGEFKFEVLEAWGVGNVYENKEVHISADSEGFFGRKTYADSVTGAYYANRLAVAEFLKKIQRQANVIVFREISQEYYAPLGVGILRELSRKALTKNPDKVNSVDEAIAIIGKRFLIPIEKFKASSKILEVYGKQKKIKDFI